MRLTKPAPPPEIMSVLRTGLTDFVEPNDPLATLPNYEAHEVFSLRLDKTAANAVDFAKEATSTGWRFMAAGSASDLGCHVGGTGPKVMGVTHTPEIHVMLHRLFQMDDHMRKPPGDWPKMPDWDYQLRALRIPGLLLEVLWMHCPEHPEDDHVVPFAGFAENVALELMRPYSAKEFLDKIKKVAKKRLENHQKLYPEDYPTAAVTQPKSAATASKRSRL